MTTTRRTYLARALRVAAGAGGLGVLVGCAAPGAGSTEPPAASAQPVTIRFPEDAASPTDSAFAADFVARFNAKNPQIQVRNEDFPDPDWGKRYEKYTAMAIAGTMPEIVWLCCTYIRPFMINGQAMELDKFLKKDWKPSELDDFYKGPLEAMKVDGKQLALPFYVNTNILFVNKGHLKEAGLPYPDEAWDRARFLDVMTKVARRGGERWGYDMRFAGADRNVTWIWNNGAEPHDPKDGPVVTKLTYDDPKTVEGLQFLHDLIWKHQVSPAVNEQRGGVGEQDAFINGKTAFYMDATGSGAAIQTRAGNNLDWDFAPLVKGPGGYGARISTDGYLIDRGTKYGDQAWAVLKELTGPEAETQRATLSKRQPARKSVAAAWEKGYEGKNAKLGRAMAETAKADARAFWKDASVVEPILGKYLDATFKRNELPVGQAMKQAMDEIRGYYAGK